MVECVVKNGCVWSGSTEMVYVFVLSVTDGRLQALKKNVLSCIILQVKNIERYKNRRTIRLQKCPAEEYTFRQ
jgi:hypothetical protein